MTFGGALYLTGITLIALVAATIEPGRSPAADAGVVAVTWPLVLLLSGYYEWQDTPAGKQPRYFTRRDGALVTTAGLRDRWRIGRPAM